MTPRTAYFVAFACYVLSFALPGIRMPNAVMSGFDSAMIVISTLSYWNGLLNYALKVFINLSNLLTLLVFLLQFAIGLGRLRYLQLIALVSGTYWIGSAVYGRFSFATFHIGFWLWYASLIGLFVSAWIAGRRKIAS